MKKKILKAASEKCHIAYRETIQVIMGFLSEIQRPEDSRKASLKC